jgi:phenylacetate-CoA ligase
MIVVQGVNIYPSQIEQILTEIEGAEPHYRLKVDRNGALDELEVWVEVSGSIFFDEIKKMSAIEQEIQRRIEESLGLSIKVRLVEPGSIKKWKESSENRV